MATAAPTSIGKILPLLAISGIVTSMAQTIIVPLIVQLPHIFDTSASNTSWVVTATLLSSAIVTPITGRLADMHGKKRMMLIVLIPFILGSLLCALAPSLPLMIVGRAIQGLGSGMVPLSMSLLHDVLPRDLASTGIAYLSASMGIGGSLGLPIAAAVAQYAGWRVMFAAVAVAGVFIFLLIWRRVPEGRVHPSAHRFDFTGALTMGLGLVCLLLAISKGSSWGWGSAVTLSCVGIAVVVFAFWGWWEKRTPGALVNVRLATKPVLMLANGAGLLLGFTMMTTSLIIPQIYQIPASTGYGLGQTMFQTGLWMAPSGIVMLVLTPYGAKITKARGPKTTLVLGACIVACGYLLAILLMGSPIGLVLSSCVASVGVGFAYGAMPALIMRSVPDAEKAAANSLNALMRSVGLTSASAVIGAMLAALTVSVDGMRYAAHEAIVLGLACTMGAALVAAIVAACIPQPKSHADSATPNQNAAGAA